MLGFFVGWGHKTVLLQIEIRYNINNMKNYIKVFAVVLLSIVSMSAMPSYASAASRYWVGGTGNWSDTAHWSDTSGGTTVVAVPTSSDNVIFDVNSASANYTVTVNAASNCADMTWSNPSSGKPTLAGGYALNVYGNISLVAGMGYTHGNYLYMKATSGTKTILSNGVTITSILTFNGSGATFQLSDNLTLSNPNGPTRSAGTFDANGKTVTILASSRVMGFTGTSSFYNLTVTGAAVTYSTFYFYENVTINGTFTATGNSATNRLFIYSSTLGTRRTITANAVSLSNVDFQDIGGAGTATWAGTSIGNALGNNGITFTPAVTRYWVATSGGSWSSTSSWSASSGGASGDSVPLVHDTVVFDANSITSTGKTITINMQRVPNIDFSNVLNSPNVTFSSGGGMVYTVGSFNLTGVNTFTPGTNVLAFWGRGANLTLTTNEKTFAGVYMYGLGSTLSIVGNLNISNIFLCGASGVVTPGLNSTVTLSGTGYVWNWNSACAFNANGSTIKFTNTSNSAVNLYAAGSTLFNNVWFSRGASTGTITIYGSSMFNDFKDDGTAAHSLIFTAGTTQNVNTFTVSGTPGNLITLNSSSTSTFNLVKSGGGTISTDYLNIQHSVATPANTWTTGSNSINNQGVATAGSGWSFGVAPPVPPTLTSYTNSTDGALSYSAPYTTCGARIGPVGFYQTITITGSNFGTDPGAGNRSTATNNVKVGIKKIADTNITAWGPTSITFITNSSATGDTDSDWGTNFGGSSALTVTAGGQASTSGLNFYLYPQITSTSVVGLPANTAREYLSTDTDGVLTLNGTRLGTDQGSGYARLFGYDVSVSSWSNTAIVVQVPTVIPDNVYTGLIEMSQGSGGNSAFTNTFVLPLRILPRITSISPSAGSFGDIIQLNGNHFCQSGSCPLSLSRSTATDNVVFTTTQAANSDFQTLTGGAGSCNGTGSAWTYKEICLRVPQGATNGNIQETSDTYASNGFSFTIGSAAASQEVTSATVQGGNHVVYLNWTNPVSQNLKSILVIQRPGTSAPTDVPVDGTTYTIGNALGLSTVVCVVNAPSNSCVDRGLINGQSYSYRIFTRGVNGNYSSF